MQILALDTTTRAGSVAVVRGGAVLAEQSGDPSLTHGQRLPGDIARVLDAAGIGVNDLDLLAVAAGPGSFTGLRVGIATVQGLAIARRVNVVPVPTLEALARSLVIDAPHDLVAAWMDGQRGEVFGVVYDKQGREVMPAVAGFPERVLQGWRLAIGRPMAFVGDGAVRYREVLHKHLGDSARVIEPPLLAGTIGRIASAEPHRAVPPHQIVPIYVRRPDAELARERRHAADAEQNRELE